MVVLTPQMPPNRIVSYVKKTLVGAFGTFDFGLFANTLHPFITAHRRITCPARLAAFEAARVNIFASAKQRSVKCDFDISRGSLIYATLWQGKLSDRCVHKPILHLHLPGAPHTISSRPGCQADAGIERVATGKGEGGVKVFIIHEVPASAIFVELPLTRRTERSRDLRRRRHVVRLRCQEAFGR